MLPPILCDEAAGTVSWAPQSEQLRHCCLRCARSLDGRQAGSIWGWDRSQEEDRGKTRIAPPLPTNREWPDARTLRSPESWAYFAGGRKPPMSARALHLLWGYGRCRQQTQGASSSEQKLLICCGLLLICKVLSAAESQSSCQPTWMGKPDSGASGSTVPNPQATAQQHRSRRASPMVRGVATTATVVSLEASMKYSLS